jgi:hypothetical protein
MLEERRDASLDRRTKRLSEVQPVTIPQLLEDLGPRLVKRHRTIAARAQEVLDLPPLALTVDSHSCTFDRGEVRPGVDPKAVVAVMPPDELTGLINGVRSTQALVMNPEVELSRRGHVRFIAWEHVLRAFLDGRPLQDPGDVSFTARDGSPLDLGRSFAPDDADADIAQFLAEAGFLHLRGWIEPGLLPATDEQISAPRAGPSETNRTGGGRRSSLSGLKAPRR